MQMIQTKAKITLWIVVVYILSFICYLPMVMQQFGTDTPDLILNLKYLFIFIPTIITTLVLLSERNLKTRFTQLFSKKIIVKELSVCLVFLLLGIFASCCYSIGIEIDLFRNAYPSIATLLYNCLYLTATALIEEIAWRGFLLERVSAKGKSIGAIMFVGVIWALWHLPMWTIRNSLSLSEIVPLFIWTVLISIILGTVYYQCKNIFVISLLHMIFNICFLLPTIYNIVVLVIFIVIIGLIKNLKSRRL